MGPIYENGIAVSSDGGTLRESFSGSYGPKRQILGDPAGRGCEATCHFLVLWGGGPRFLAHPRRAKKVTSYSTRIPLPSPLQSVEIRSTNIEIRNRFEIQNSKGPCSSPRGRHQPSRWSRLVDTPCSGPVVRAAGRVSYPNLRCCRPSKPDDEGEGAAFWTESLRTRGVKSRTASPNRRMGAG